MSRSLFMTAICLAYHLFLFYLQESFTLILSQHSILLFQNLTSFQVLSLILKLRVLFLSYLQEIFLRMRSNLSYTSPFHFVIDFDPISSIFFNQFLEKLYFQLIPSSYPVFGLTISLFQPEDLIYYYKLVKYYILSTKYLQNQATHLSIYQVSISISMNSSKDAKELNFLYEWMRKARKANQSLRQDIRLIFALIHIPINESQLKIIEKSINPHNNKDYLTKEDLLSCFVVQQQCRKPKEKELLKAFKYISNDKQDISFDELRDYFNTQQIDKGTTQMILKQLCEYQNVQGHFDFKKFASNIY